MKTFLLGCVLLSAVGCHVKNYPNANSLRTESAATVAQTLVGWSCVLTGTDEIKSVFVDVKTRADGVKRAYLRNLLENDEVRHEVEFEFDGLRITRSILLDQNVGRSGSMISENGAEFTLEWDTDSSSRILVPEEVTTEDGRTVITAKPLGEFLGCKTTTVTLI